MHPSRSWRTHVGVLSTLVVAGAVAAACGSSDGSIFPNAGTDSGVGDGSGLGPDPGFVEDDDGGNATKKLRVEPPQATIQVSGTIAAPVGTAQFQAFVGSASTPSEARWSLDNVAFGKVSSSGLFSSAGVPGTTKVYATVGALSGSADVTVVAKLLENPGGVSDANQAKLRTGGSADGAFKWLYPYDQTVFPRGLAAPLLQFAGAKPAAYYLHVKYTNFEYEGFYTSGAGNAARLTVSPAWWKVISAGAGAGTPITVEISKLDAAGKVTGPIRETWNIAPASLKGTVFYNSYNSALAGKTGAVLRIKPGSNAELMASYATVGGEKKKCVVCHTVSANGTTLAAGADWGDDGGNPNYSALWNISATAAPTLKYTNEEGRRLPFGALTPDGTWLLGNGVPDSGVKMRGIKGAFPSRLYDARTGEPVNDSYFGSGTKTFLSPTFSPDTKWLAFNDRNASDGHTLGLLSFNAATNPPTASNYQSLYTSTAIAAWPTFTPDSKAVVFHEGDSIDTGGGNGTDNVSLHPHYADLKWLDVATKTVTHLAALNGCKVKAGGGFDCYLPYGETEEGHLNYEPTILPVAVGGYYWVVFTSRRAYGNSIYDGPYSVRPDGDKAFDNGEYENADKERDRGFRKKLWVAAIDVQATPGTDPSHPAFYLEGQEIQAGNMRGFWALDPCKSDGNNCETGDDCCGGFCRQVSLADGATGKQCVPPPTTCSNDSERCNITADCCNSSSNVECINHVCSLVKPK